MQTSNEPFKISPVSLHGSSPLSTFHSFISGCVIGYIGHHKQFSYIAIQRREDPLNNLEQLYISGGFQSMHPWDIVNWILQNLFSQCHIAQVFNEGKY